MSQPGLVVERLARQLLGPAEHGHFAIISDLKRALVAIVEEHQRRRIHFIDYHLTLMQSLSVKVPGCSLCILKVPVHLQKCGHSICDFCLDMIAERFVGARVQFTCPICATASDSLSDSPLSAGIRALGLFGNPVQVLQYLSKMRMQLFGPLKEYFDIIFCTESCKISADLKEHS